MRAVQITEFGGPEVLELIELPDPEPGPGEVVVDVAVAGVNYADTHQVENSYLAPQELPLLPGSEVAGTTPDGRRVCGLVGGASTGGGYAEKALLREDAAFPIPDGVTDQQAVALLVQGLTAWHLLRTSARLVEGESVVVHAAAGGVGTLAVQLAARWGAGQVIGAASTEDKRALATRLGATATIDSRADDMKAAITEAAGGRVDVVLDMVGGATTDGSLAALAAFGRLCHFGMASREAPTPVPPAMLMQRSRSIVGFWLVDCMRDPARMLAAPMQELFTLVASGDLEVVTADGYPLSDVRRAHEDMLARRTTGKVTLDCTA